MADGSGMTWEEHQAHRSHAIGEVFPFPNTPGVSGPGQSLVGGSINPAAEDHQHNIVVPNQAFTPTDSSVQDHSGFPPGDVIDGVMVYNSNTDRLFIRIGGVWRWAQFT